MKKEMMINSTEISNSFGENVDIFHASPEDVKTLISIPTIQHLINSDEVFCVVFCDSKSNKCIRTFFEYNERTRRTILGMINAVLQRKPDWLFIFAESYYKKLTPEEHKKNLKSASEYEDAETSYMQFSYVLSEGVYEKSSVGYDENLKEIFPENKSVGGVFASLDS
jgi:predicted AAA+ superfamily ATPase